MERKVFKENSFRNIPKTITKTSTLSLKNKNSCQMKMTINRKLSPFLLQDMKNGVNDHRLRTG